MSLNRALVFVKPHAVSDQTIDYVREHLKTKTTILSEGRITAQEIKEKGLIDSHYFAISKYAIELHPREIVASEAKLTAFQELFNVSWKDCLDKDVLVNGEEAHTRLNVTYDQLSEKVSKAQAAKLSLKLGPGLYVVHLSEDNLFVVNGFYFQLRQAFVVDGAQIHYYIVDFNPSEMSWENFRREFIGETDPSKAVVGSLRNKLYVDHEKLGFDKPNQGNNGVHASAGPLEGLKERMVWTGAVLEEDPAGALFLQGGVQKARLEEWLLNKSETVDGTTGPIFDLTEEKDTEEVLKILQKLTSA